MRDLLFYSLRHHHHHKLQDCHSKRQINHRNRTQSTETDDNKYSAISQQGKDGLFGIGRSGSPCGKTSQSVCHTVKATNGLQGCRAIDPLDPQDGQGGPKVARAPVASISGYEQPHSFTTLCLAHTTIYSLCHDIEKIEKHCYVEKNEVASLLHIAYQGDFQVDQKPKCER